MSRAQWCVFGSTATIPAGPSIFNPGLKRFNDCIVLDRAGLSDALRPRHDALILRNGELMHDLGGAVAFSPRRQELLVCRRVELGAVVAGDENAVAFR